MSGRPCVACGKGIPDEVFAGRGAGEVFCPWCAEGQSADAAAPSPGVSIEAGHPKVRRTIEGEAITYDTRLGSCFGWIWLIFTVVHFGFMFYGMSQGSVKVNGRLVSNPDWWMFALLGLFYLPFFVVGLAFTVSRYSVRLTPERLRVRWRFFPGLGWTWELATGADVVVRQAYRGAKENKRPVMAIVVASQGQEIDFGNFLAKDIKAFLVAAIRDYYGDSPPASAPADFIA